MSKATRGDNIFSDVPEDVLTGDGSNGQQPTQTQIVQNKTKQTGSNLFSQVPDDIVKKKVSGEPLQPTLNTNSPTPLNSEAPSQSQNVNSNQPAQNGIDKIGVFDPSGVLTKPQQGINKISNDATPQELATNNIQQRAQTKAQLVTGINQYNNLTGTDNNPDDILSSADKTAQFLQKVKELKAQRPIDINKQNQQDIQSNLEYGTPLPNALNKNNTQNELFDQNSFVNEANQYITGLTDHVIKKTIEEDNQNSIPKDQTIVKIAQRTNPRNYKNAADAQEPTTPDSGYFNPVQDISDLYDKVVGTTSKDDLLNSVKGEAELQYNYGLQQIATDKISDGIATKNQDLIQDGQAQLKSIDDQAIYKYPTLVKKQIVDDVNNVLKTRNNEGNANDIMKELGYLDNPKTKDIATQLESQPELFSDTPYAEGALLSFSKPIADLFYGAGDLTGFRNKKDILSDKINDELFPLSGGNLNTARKIVNTSFNLVGMIAVAGATEGLGAEAGLSKTAAERLGAYTSFGIPSVDQNLKESYNFLDNDAARYTYALAGGILNAEGGKLLDLAKISRVPELNNVFTNFAKQVSDKTITEDAAKELLAKGQNPYVDFVLKYGKNVNKGAATMAYFNATNNILKAAYGDPSVTQKDIISQAGTSYIDGLLGMSVLGGFGAASEMSQEKNTSYKGFIYNMALNHDATADMFKMALDKGEYTQDEYNQKMGILNTAKAAKSAVDLAEQQTGTNLNPNQKSVYVANKTAEQVLRNRADNTDNEELKNQYLTQADRLNQQNQDIFKGLNFSPTLEPLYNLFDAEKNYNDELAKFNSGESKDDKALLTAKEKYETLQKQTNPNTKLSQPIEGLDENGVPQVVQEVQSEKQESLPKQPQTTKLATSGTETVKNDFDKAKSFIASPEATKSVESVVNKMNSAEYINENESNDAANHLYKILDDSEKKYGANSVLHNSLANLIEPLITKIEGYEFKTKTETRTVTETKPVEGVDKTERVITPALEQSIGTDASIQTADGTTTTGKLNVKDGNYVIEHDNGEPIQIGETQITNRDLKLPDESKVPEPIAFDEDGNVKSVTFETKKGDLVTIHDPEKALDLAIQLRADAVGEIPEDAFEKTYQEVAKEVKVEVPLTQSNSSQSNNNNEIKNENASESSGQNGNQSGSQKSNVLNEGKNDGQENDEGKGVLKPTPEKGTGATTEPVPSLQQQESEEDNVTHINKDDITKAEDLAKTHPLQGGSVSWNESVSSAIGTLAKEAKKGETLPDVANRKIAEWGQKIDKELSERGKSTFNPTDEDLAIMSYYRTHLNERLDGLKDRINSSDDATRLSALAEAKEIQDKILGVDRVLSESGKVAGRSFYIRQMVAKMDADNNLQVRRMDLMRSQNGEPLSPEQESAVIKIAAEENKLQKESDKSIPKYSQEDFDAKVKQEVDRITKEKQKNKGKSENKTDKTLSQSGKEWADKIRKLKTQKGDTALDITFGLKNLGVELVAQLVEKGATIAEAIKQVLKDARFKGITEDDLTKHIIGGIEKEDTLNKIKELSDEQKNTSLTKDAVSKGLINDLINHHIENGLRGKELFNQVHSDLKEVLPSVSEQNLRDAYLKQGEFKLDKKPEIDKGKKEAQDELKNISKLESRLEDARKNKAGSKNESQKRRWTDEENKIKKELGKELNKRNIKLERSPKEEVEIKKKVAEAHNTRMDELSKSIDDKLKDKDISDEEKTALANLKNTVELSKVEGNTAEKIDNSLEKSADNLRKAAVDISDHPEILDQVSKAISDLKKDAADAKQDVLLTRHKNNLENKIKEFDRKIEANEFDESIPPIRTKSDAESIRLEIEKRKIESKYRRLQDLAEQKTKANWEKAASLAQTAYVQSLIGGVKTGGVVLSSGLTKQPLNTITNAIFGNIAHFFNPTLSHAAGAEAPFSLRQEANRYMAHYAAIGESGMRKIFEKSEYKLKQANENLENIKDRFDKAKVDTPEYNKLEKQYKDAKNKQVQALITHQSNFLFNWIGSNAWKDSKDVLSKGASQLDELLGHQQKVGWHDMTTFEKTEMAMSMMGALHGYFKNFSARAEFAAAFTARLENKARRGVDISQPEELLRTANESFVNFLMGKYQEDNLVTTTMNRFSNLLEEIGNEPSNQGVDRNPKNAVAAKLAATAFRGKYPIIRTGVNIGREAIVEYLLGSPYGAYLHGKENVKAIYKAIKEGSPIRESIRENISKMSPDKVDLIFRCYRKGGIGLVGMALAAMGYIKFGGFYNKDDSKRKQGELKQGEVEIFGHVFDHKSLVAKAFTHNPATMGALMVANTRQVYDRKFNRGKDKGDKESAISDALVSDLEGAAAIIPVLNNNFGANPLSNMSVPYGRAAADISEQFDTDSNGNPIQRDNSTWWNRFKNNTGFRVFSPVKEASTPSNPFPIYDKKTNTKRESTKEEMQSFGKLKNQLFTDDTKDLQTKRVGLNRYGDVTIDARKIVKYKNGKDLTPDEQDKLIKEYEGKASREAKNKLFGEGQPEN